MPQHFQSGTEALTPNPVLPAVLYPGDDCYVFGTSFAAGQPPTPGIIQAPNDANVQFETVAVDERSIAVNLASRPGGGAAPGVMVMVVANGNPGAAEIDVQDAGIDADGAYETNTSSAAYKMTVWTQEGANWVSWTELQPEGARFITLLCVANPNGVKFTAKISYV
jgi:hypothetical protein